MRRPDGQRRTAGRLVPVRLKTLKLTAGGRADRADGNFPLCLSPHSIASHLELEIPIPGFRPCPPASKELARGISRIHAGSTEDQRSRPRGCNARNAWATVICRARAKERVASPA